MKTKKGKWFTLSSEGDEYGVFYVLRTKGMPAFKSLTFFCAKEFQNTSGLRLKLDQTAEFRLEMKIRGKS